MITFTLIFSFLFESVFSNIVLFNHLLNPFFSIVALSILYPYFNGKKGNFIIVSIIIGLLYDITLNDSGFVNTICFFFTSYIIILLYELIKYSIYSSNIISILSIIFNRILSFLILFIIDYISFDLNILYNAIINSLIANLVYGILLFIIVKLIANIMSIKVKR